MAKQTKAALEAETLDVVADRSTFSSEEILACEEAGITVTLPKPLTTGKERRMTRWEHEDILEAVQRRLDEHPEKIRQRRETVEHPFGTIKFWMGATHFQMKTLKKVATEMALHVLAYNLKRVINIIAIAPLIAAMKA